MSCINAISNNQASPAAVAPPLWGVLGFKPKDFTVTGVNETPDGDIKWEDDEAPTPNEKWYGGHTTEAQHTSTLTKTTTKEFKVSGNLETSKEGGTRWEDDDVPTPSDEWYGGVNSKGRSDAPFKPKEFKVTGTTEIADGKDEQWEDDTPRTESEEWYGGQLKNEVTPVGFVGKEFKVVSSKFQAGECGETSEEAVRTPELEWYGGFN